MKGQKIVLVAGAVLAGGLCLGGAWMAWRAFAKADDVRKTLDETLGKLQSAYRKNPFPSRANVAVITNDACSLRDWNATLSRDLNTGGDGAATNGLTPSAFIQQLQHTVRELDALAARSGGKVVPDGFAYGFGQYLGANGGMPKPEDVKRLDIQLRMVDAVTRELLAGHVSGIASVEREVFEAGAEGAPGISAAGGGHRGGHHAAAPSRPAVSAAPALGRAYPHQHFTVTFDANEFALDEALDRLAAIPLFVVVSDLSIQRGGRGLRSFQETADGDKTKTGAPASVEPAEAKAKASILPRAQRIASGPDVMPTLKVRMSFDVYTFEGA